MGGASPADADGDGVGADIDCDDSDATVGEPTTYFPDSDGDGYGDALASVASCQPLADHLLEGTDCDDTRETVFPGAPTDNCDLVDSDCDGVVEELVVPRDHATVGAALAAANDGDRICLQAGTFEESVIANKAVLIEGAGVANTVLSGSETSRVVELDGPSGASQPLTLRRLQVTSGTAAVGAGILARGEVTISEVYVHDNKCQGDCDGVGIAIASGAKVTIEDARVSDNQGQGEVNGHRIQGAGIHINNAEATLRRVDIDGNRIQAPMGSTMSIIGEGAGLDCRQSTTILEDVYIANNEILHVFNGGGAGLSHVGGSTSGVHVELRGNVIDGPGFGAAMNASFGTLSLLNSLIADNSTLTNTAVSAGISLFLDADFTNVTIWNNHEVASNGVVYMVGPSGASVNFLNVDVSGNTSSGLSRGLYQGSPNFSVNVSYSNVYGHDDDYFLMPDPTGMNGNVKVDPGYLAMSPAPTSAALINGGDPNITDTDNTRSDMGCFGGPQGNWTLGRRTNH